MHTNIADPVIRYGERCLSVRGVDVFDRDRVCYALVAYEHITAIGTSPGGWGGPGMSAVNIAAVVGGTTLYVANPADVMSEIMRRVEALR